MVGHSAIGWTKIPPYFLSFFSHHLMGYSLNILKNSIIRIRKYSALGYKFPEDYGKLNYRWAVWFFRYLVLYRRVSNKSNKL